MGADVNWSKYFRKYWIFWEGGGASGWSVGVPAKAATLKPIHSLDPSGNEREAAAEESVSLRKASSRWSQVPETERESKTMGPDLQQTVIDAWPPCNPRAQKWGTQRWELSDNYNLQSHFSGGSSYIHLPHGVINPGSRCVKIPVWCDPCSVWLPRARAAQWGRDWQPCWERARSQSKRDW